MKKSEYKKMANFKNQYLDSRLRDKKYLCVSDGWIKWAKNYRNRSTRREGKQKKYDED